MRRLDLDLDWIRWASKARYVRTKKVVSFLVFSVLKRVLSKTRVCGLQWASGHCPVQPCTWYFVITVAFCEEEEEEGGDEKTERKRSRKPMGDRTLRSRFFGP